MAVAQVTTVQATPGTGSSFTITATVSGTNPAVEIGIALHTTTVTVSTVTSSLSGTVAVVKSAINVNIRVYVYKVTAPASGSTTFTITLSASSDYNGYARVWSDADQTDPIPVADAVTSTANTDPLTLTPTNLAANDASGGVGANNSGNWVAGTPTQRIIDNSSLAGMLVADATGTTGVTFDNDGGIGASDIALIAVRVAQASGGGAIALEDSGNFPGFEAQSSPTVISIW